MRAGLPPPFAFALLRLVMKLVTGYDTDSLNKPTTSFRAVEDLQQGSKQTNRIILNHAC